MSILPLFLFILPLGLDTLGVSISLGIKSRRDEIVTVKRLQFPVWLISAILFSLAETFMPIFGLAIGFSLGTIPVSHMGVVTVHPFIICIIIGVQGFFMTLLGTTFGRMLHTRLSTLKEWTEFLSAFLLIVLGIWLLAA